MSDTLAKLRSLTERNYVLPTGPQAMYDFYGLYAAWWDAGHGKEEYGFNPTTVPNEKRRNAINDAFSQATYQLGYALVRGILAAAKEELEHLEDEYLIPPAAFADWAENTESRYQRKFKNMVETGMVVLPKNVWDTLGAQGVYELFSAPFWQEHADLFGGQRWADIVSQGVALLKLLKGGAPLTKIAYAIDQLYDLEHNTGFLGDKLGAHSIKKADLDRRARLRQTLDFLPYVSKPVKDLLVGSANYLKPPKTESVRCLIKAKALLDSAL